MRVFLANAIFWLAALSSAAAQVMILRSAIVSPPSPASDRGRLSARRAMEIAWAGLPGIALAVLFVFTWRAMHAAAPLTSR
jgi:heme/copper-type cytochrome/quinol oxidase subunit 2